MTINFKSTNTTPKSTIDFKPLAQQPAKGDGFFASLVKDPINTLLITPAVRTGQAIGAGLVKTFGTEQMKANLPGALSKDTSFGGFKVPGVKPFGEGGGKQIVGEALGTAAYLAPYGKMATGASAGLKAIGMGEKLAKPIGAIASGAAGGYAVDVGNKLKEGKIDFTPGLGTALGAAIPAAGPITKGIGRGVGESLGTLTGTGYGAIKEAWNAAITGGERLKSFNEGLSGSATANKIVNEAKDSLDTIIKNRSDAYKEQLSKVKAVSGTFDVKPVVEKFNTMLNDFGVDVTPEGPDFSRAPGLGRYEKDLTKLSKVIGEWGTKPGDLTLQGIDKLKQTIGEFKIGSQDSKKFDSFVNSLYNEAKGLGKNEPAYQKLLADYSSATENIKEIQKGLSLGDKTSVETAFKKLTSALRINNDFRKQFIKELDDASGGFLSSKIAGQQMSEWLPRGMIRSFEVGGSALGVLSGSVGALPLIKGALFTSPKIVAGLIEALGFPIRKAQGLVDAIEKNAGKIRFPGDVAVEDISKRVSGIQQTIKETPGKQGGYVSLPKENKVVSFFKDWVYRDPEAEKNIGI